MEGLKLSKERQEILISLLTLRKIKLGEQINNQVGYLIKAKKRELGAINSMLKEIDDRGIIATPANSYFNELVDEAARISILDDGVSVDIVYGDNPYVKRRG